MLVKRSTRWYANLAWYSTEYKITCPPILVAIHLQSFSLNSLACILYTLCHPVGAPQSELKIIVPKPYTYKRLACVYITASTHKNTVVRMIILLFCADFRARIGRVEIDGFSHICLALLNIKTSIETKKIGKLICFFFLSFLSSLRYCCHTVTRLRQLFRAKQQSSPLLDASPRFLFSRKTTNWRDASYFFQSQKLVAIQSAKKKRNEKVSWHTSSLVVVGIFDRGGKTTKF